MRISERRAGACRHDFLLSGLDCFYTAFSQGNWAILALSFLVPVGAVLQRRAQQRLVNQKQYREAKRLLKEFRARYRQLVRSSLRTVFAASPPPRPPTRRALSAGQPKLGRFLEFMDEFCQEPTASDSKE